MVAFHRFSKSILRLYYVSWSSQYVIIFINSVLFLLSSTQCNEPQTWFYGTTPLGIVTPVYSKYLYGDIVAAAVDIIFNGDHYDDVKMTTMESQITSLTVVHSNVYSDTDQRKHQSSASLAFVWGIHRDRWIPRTKGQLRGKCFHLMTSSWYSGETMTYVEI